MKWTGIALLSALLSLSATSATKVATLQKRQAVVPVPPSLPPVIVPPPPAPIPPPPAPIPPPPAPIPPPPAPVPPPPAPVPPAPVPVPPAPVPVPPTPNTGPNPGPQPAPNPPTNPPSTPVPKPAPKPAPSASSNENDLGLIIGLSVGLGCLVILVLTVCFVRSRKRRSAPTAIPFDQIWDFNRIISQPAMAVGKRASALIRQNSFVRTSRTRQERPYNPAAGSNTQLNAEWGNESLMRPYSPSANHRGPTLPNIDLSEDFDTDTYRIPDNAYQDQRNARQGQAIVSPTRPARAQYIYAY